MADEGNPHRTKFPQGSFVRIKSRGELEAFRRNGILRFPPSEAQVACGEKIDSIRRITPSIRGGVLYGLEIALGFGTRSCYRDSLHTPLCSPISEKY